MNSLSVPKENNLSNDQEVKSAVEMRRLMDAYGNDVLRTSYMYLKDMQRAEDAFQEVFIKVFSKHSEFMGKSSEKTWIIKITINVCKDILRNSWLKRILLTDKITPREKNFDLDTIIIKNDEKEILFHAVFSLPSVFKEVITLYYYEGFDTVEISKILNVAVGTVRSRLYRAREILKKKLGGRIDFSE